MATQIKAVKDYKGQKFIIVREFDAPRELVFKAWTDPKQIAKWWGPRGFTNPVCEWDVRHGGEIFVVMRAPNGNRYPMGGQFRDIVPPEKLVFACGALDEKGDLLFEFLHTAIFTERNGKTKLTLHSVVTMTTAEAGKYIGGFKAGMTQSLERLAKLVKTKPLILERTLAAPVEKVWQAITDAEVMRRWYFDVENFKPQTGCEFRFVVEYKGNIYDHRCKVMEVVPHKKIAYTWRYHGQEGESLVAMELFRVGRKTRLKLTHTGLETFPKTSWLARKNFQRGWNSLIGDSLPDLVENLDREFFLFREFTAPRELVWEAMTNPKHVVNWWGPRGFTTTMEKMDFRVGGVWKHVMHGPDGVNYPNEKVFKEIVPQEKIVFTHGGRRENGPSVDAIATWTFDKIGKDKTRVSLRMVFPSMAERNRIEKQVSATEGAKQTLERFGEYVAKM